MQLRIASLMKLVAVVAVDFGMIAWLRRSNAFHDLHDPLRLFSGLFAVIFLLVGTPFLVMANWPFARKIDD